MKEIFLSASVPIKGREYFEGSDPLLIQSAVRAFATLALGRRHIVWGGHPSITPMMWAVCESLGVSYARCVTLYQSTEFSDFFPEENANFRNVHYIRKRKNLSASLRSLRIAMLRRIGLEAAVFIGGMQGLAQEYELFKEFHPNKTCLFVSSPGGAAAALAARQPDHFGEDENSTNFTSLYVRALKISPSERRNLD